MKIFCRYYDMRKFQDFKIRNISEINIKVILSSPSNSWPESKSCGNKCGAKYVYSKLSIFSRIWFQKCLSQSLIIFKLFVFYDQYIISIAKSMFP